MFFYNVYGVLMAAIPGITLGLLYAFCPEGPIFNFGLIGSMIAMILVDLKLRLSGREDTGLLTPTGGGMLMFIPCWMLGLFMIVLNCVLWIQDAKTPIANKLNNAAVRGNYTPVQRIEKVLKVTHLQGKVDPSNRNVKLSEENKTPRKEFLDKVATALPTLIYLQVKVVQVDFKDGDKVVKHGVFDMKSAKASATEQKFSMGNVFIEPEIEPWFKEKR